MTPKHDQIVGQPVSIYSKLFLNKWHVIKCSQFCHCVLIKVYMLILQVTIVASMGI